jgi:hypothetical protein
MLQPRDRNSGALTEHEVRQRTHITAQILEALIRYSRTS